MVQIDDVIVSLDVFREKFVCNLDACKGECCIEGDATAPWIDQSLLFICHCWLVMHQKTRSRKAGRGTSCYMGRTFSGSSCGNR